MPRKVRVKRYTRTAMFLHWAAALGIFTLFLHGLYIPRLPADVRAEVLGLHRSIGVALLLLVLVRIAWRVTHAPPQPPRMSTVQESCAHFVHIWLYTLIVGNGISGVLGWLFSGDAIVFFGVDLPIAGGYSAAVDRVSHIVGYTTARALGISVVLHVLAALKHQYIDRDRLLARMWLSFTTIEYRIDRTRERRRSRRRSREAPDRPHMRDGFTCVMS